MAGVGAAGAGMLKAVGSWLAGNAGAIATSAAGTAAGAGAASLLAPDVPGAPKATEQPVPDDKKRRIANERKLATAYAERGSVASAFGRDRLG